MEAERCVQLGDPVERPLGGGGVPEGELEEAPGREQLEAGRIDADPLRELDALVDPRPRRVDETRCASTSASIVIA